MNILVIGKYPPTEGGVSATNYWTCRILAENGHTVHVLTNANETGWSYKMWLVGSDLDALKIQPVGGSPGSLAVHYPDVVPYNTYVPWANPFVTKLTGAAVRLVKELGCDLIYSHYLEPYGVAAMFAAALTYTPYAVRHAGSDIGRLAPIPSLGETYREVIHRAAAVITTSRKHFERLQALGATESNLVVDPTYSVQTDYFNRLASPLELNSVLGKTEQWAKTIGYPPDIAFNIRSLNEQHVDPAIPVVGIYGKIGETKGTFDLLEAIRIVLQKREAYLVMMVNGPIPAWNKLFSIVKRSGIIRWVRVLPFLPHWKVPSFIRACRAVCFLERKFPISFHSPVVSREILACAAPLICSEEIAKKSTFRTSVVNGRNMLVVNPKNHTILAEAISSLLRDKELAQTVGYEGHNLSLVLENFTFYHDTRSRLFEKLLNKAHS